MLIHTASMILVLFMVHKLWQINLKSKGNNWEKELLTEDISIKKRLSWFVQHLNNGDCNLCILNSGFHSNRATVAIRESSFFHCRQVHKLRQRKP